MTATTTPTTRRWQVQVSVGTLNSCVPEYGRAGVSSLWLEAGEATGLTLSLQECIFTIRAVVREASRTGCWYTAHLAWGDPRDGNLDYAAGSVITASRPDDVSRLSIVREPGGACAVANQTHFVIWDAAVVEDPTWTSIGSDLLALARRAAAVGEFDVRVEPDYPPAAVPAGCNRTTTFTVRGDGQRVSQVLQNTGEACRLRALVVGAPAGFELDAGSGASFDSAAANILVNLSSQVRLSPARIAIIQDVRGSGNRGAASYTISRSCGDVSIASSPPAEASAPLYEGRFTVHSPDAVAFGPVAVYPVLATSATSTTVAGCSVTVAIDGLPGGCTVIGSEVQTLSWTDAGPIGNFDFEFDIECGVPATTTTITTTTTTEPTDPPPPPAEDPAGAVLSTDADVRIVARKRDNGKIEFGLQQQQEDDSWGDRLLPSRRFFPTTAAANRWLASTPQTISVAASADAFSDDIEVRIVARRLENGRVEFGLQERDDDDSWGDRLLPTRRFFPADARVGRWLHSSLLRVDTE